MRSLEYYDLCMYKWFRIKSSSSSNSQNQKEIATE